METFIGWALNNKWFLMVNLQNNCKLHKICRSTVCVHIWVYFKKFEAVGSDALFDVIMIEHLFCGW